MSSKDLSPTVPSTYGSARDLPSYQEMARLIQGGKLLTLFIARDQRAKMIEIERDMQHLADVVDRFYERLGSRNWIFHESLNVSKVEEILDETDDPVTAEKRLIDYYRDKENTRFWDLRLRGVVGLRERLHQIERARGHYDADKFDSCVLHLIAVMDGFVNDFEPDARKGLASREPDDMAAWDSVVGHHMGLTHALKTFTKTIKKRIDEEVFEVHRHGIMHGSIVRFDNVVVATKAWNMLFAVSDWARATAKSREPPPSNPSFRELVGQLNENRRLKEKLDEWKYTILRLGDDGFEDHEIHRLTIGFLSAWSSRNYGALADFASLRFGDAKQKGERAGEMRNLFDGFMLTEFEINEAENSAPALWLARGRATVNGETGSFECRWLVETEDGSPGFGTAGGTWRLVFCDPTVWRRDESL